MNDSPSDDDLSFGPTDDELYKELREEIKVLKKRFEQCSSKGCQSTIYKKPVNLEPQVNAHNPGYYNRKTSDIVVLRLHSSPLDNITPDSAELFLGQLRNLNEPVSFEVIGSQRSITIQIVAQRKDVSIIQTSFSGICNNSYLGESSDAFFTRYSEIISEIKKDGKSNKEFQFNDYYLKAPYYFPLNTYKNEFKGDILESVFHIFSELKQDELGFYQVLFIPTKRCNWTTLSRELLEMRVQRLRYKMGQWFRGGYIGHTSVPMQTPEGKPFHPVLDDSELKIHTAKFLEKTEGKKPFFAVSLRVGLFVGKGRAGGILNNLRGLVIRVVPSDSYIRFLTRKDYYKKGIPEKLHYYMFFNRVSLREGMLLTSKELSGIVHFPTQRSLEKDYALKVAKGRRSPPDFLISSKEGLMLGEANYKGKMSEIRLADKQRASHTHIVGVPGRGKSTFIAHCVLQDIESGTGVCVIDPHGDLIDRRIIPSIPEEKLHNVLYFDPVESPFTLNILEVKDEKEVSVVADDVVSIFRRLSDSWGVQLDEILTFGVLSILSSKQGGHLETLHTFLTDSKFRNKYLETVTDPFVVDFWENQFKHFPRGAATTVLRRLNQFLRNPVLRSIVTSDTSSVNFREIMDGGKALLINLPLGEIGSTNAYMLGSLIISRIQAAALTRQDIPEEQRKPFYLYIDEFQNFMCRSIEECLAGTRKYALGLVLAHHSLEQLLARDKLVADAVLEIPNTRVCFRVGDKDAPVLAKGFSHYEAEDLKNLKTGESIVRVDGSSNDFEMHIPFQEPPSEEDIKRTRRIIITDEESDTEKEPYSRSKIDTLYQEEQKETKPKKEEPIDPDIEKVLRYISEIKDLLPVREVYEELGYSVTSGNKLKKSLIEKGYITETDTDLGRAKRKSKILTLTPKGRELLGLEPLSGKGGPFHQHLQKVIAEYASRNGYESSIEEQTKHGDRVDIGLVKNGEKTAVEIAVTTRPEQIYNNIELAQRAGYKRIIMLFTRSEILKNTKKLIDKSTSLKNPEGIILALVGDYRLVI